MGRLGLTVGGWGLVRQRAGGAGRWLGRINLGRREVEWAGEGVFEENEEG